MRVQSAALNGLLRFAQFERVLATILLATPLVLIAFNGFPPEDSISDYYKEDPRQAFFCPLTVAATMFVVNGLLKKAHWYNIVLGTSLFGLLLFDNEGRSSIIHMISTLVFFVGNAIVLIFFSKCVPAGVRVALLFSLVVIGALLVLGVLTKFWAEWISLAIISTHYILDSLPDEIVPYRALDPGEVSDVRSFWTEHRAQTVHTA